MNDLFAIGTSGLRAYRAGLNAVGDNIANAQTPGYARRGVDLRAADGGTRPTPLYTRDAATGGVRIAGVTRATDLFATAEARRSAADAGASAAARTWALATETALNAGDSDVGVAVGNVFRAGARLAADPASTAARATVLDAVDTAAGTIRDTADALAATATGIAVAQASAVSDLNGALTTLADVNQALFATPPGTTAAAALSDRRDAAIDALAALVPVQVSLDDHGTATITSGSAALIDATGARAVAIGAAGYTLAGVAFAPAGGKLGGLNEAAASTAKAQRDLDALAQSFATALNDWHAAGRTPAGVRGAALFSASTSAATLEAASLSPGDIAAASDSAANGNALALAGVRGHTGLEGRWEAIVTMQAQATATTVARDDTATARQSAAAARRDAVEGVDLDTEAAMLLRFQQSYEGAARVIQTARDTLDTVLRLFR